MQVHIFQEFSALRVSDTTSYAFPISPVRDTKHKNNKFLTIALRVYSSNSLPFTAYRQAHAFRIAEQ
jgi:hypothetical protein